MDELLLRAAEVIENRFCTQEYMDDYGNLCLHGAVIYAYMQITGVPDPQQWFVEKAADFPMPRVAVVEALRKLSRVLPIVDGCEDCGIPNTPAGHRIHHYNDDHCDGGVQAAKLCREAAEVDL